jgi:hypothetical protein
MVFRRTVLVVGAVLVALVVAGGGATVATAAAPCAPAIHRGVLPQWARGGFSDPRPRVAHVLGVHRRIAAILLGDPLTAPPRSQRSNKILWVAREAPGRGPLLIRAQRMRGTHNVGGALARRVADGPGPSIIDLPTAGCWRLTLHWPGGTDRIDLRYALRRR